MKLEDIANEDILSLFLDSVNFNYSVIDKDGNYIVQNNQMIARISAGLTNAEQIDKPSWENCKAVMKAGEKCVEEEEYKGRYFLSVKQPLFDKNIKHRCIGIRVLSFDITDRKKAELALKEAKEELERANNAKDDFLRNMQHDLHTPVGHIVGVTNILKDNFQHMKPEKVQEQLAHVNASSKALMMIIDEITSGFDVETGRIPSQIVELNLKELIQSLKDLFFYGIEQKGLQLVITYDEQIPTLLLADRVRLHRVLLNLLSNAIKFTSKGAVKISAELVKRTPNNQAIVRFRVQDSGIGIPKDKFSLLYQKFSRLHPSDSGQYPGRGLGLWIVAQFVKDLGGEIDVESVEGKGTTFTCLIPLRISLMDESYDQINVNQSR